MALLDMQRALSRVLTDGDCLRRFLLDKTAALAEFQLSPSEAAVISGIDTDRLQRHSRIILNNRLDLGLRAMPRVRKLLGQGFFAKYGLEYGRKYVPAPSPGESPIFAEFKNLLPYLQELAERHEIDAPFFSDFLQYDATLFILANDAGILQAVELFEREYRSLTDSEMDKESMPLRSPGALLHTFAVDILDTADSPAAVANGSTTHVLFHTTTRAPAIRLTKVNDVTKRALELSDGQTPIRVLAERVAKDFGVGADAGWVRKCLTMCRELSARGVLRVR